MTAREDRAPPPEGNPRRTRFAAALNAEIERRQDQIQDGKPEPGLKELAKALAVIDGRGSRAAVLGAISQPGRWDQYTCLETAQRLLMAGVEMPAATTFALVDSDSGTDRKLDVRFGQAPSVRLPRAVSSC